MPAFWVKNTTFCSINCALFRVRMFITWDSNIYFISSQCAPAGRILLYSCCFHKHQQQLYTCLWFYLVLFLCLFANLSSNGFVLANNVSQDGLWILMWLSWLDMALGLKNDRQTDISSWYAIIRCDELYRVQIPWTLVSLLCRKKRCYLHHWGWCRAPCHFWATNLYKSYMTRWAAPAGANRGRFLCTI